jgi:hypothetical protein
VPVAADPPPRRVGHPRAPGLRPGGQRLAELHRVPRGVGGTRSGRPESELGRVRLSGYLAWWLWGLAHIYFLIGFRNRLAVAMNWAWNYVSFQRGTRLITGADPEADQVSPAAVAPLRESA